MSDLGSGAVTDEGVIVPKVADEPAATSSSTENTDGVDGIQLALLGRVSVIEFGLVAPVSVYAL
jgi:hypothetical protein